MTAVFTSEGTCEHCAQHRPLFLYEPDHTVHLGGAQFSCRWCIRDTQPWLCTRCWSAERLLEDEDPGLTAEAAVFESICETNSRLAAQASS